MKNPKIQNFEKFRILKYSEIRKFNNTIFQKSQNFKTLKNAKLKIMEKLKSSNFDELKKLKFWKIK